MWDWYNKDPNFVRDDIYKKSKWNCLANYEHTQHTVSRYEIRES